MTQPTLPSLLRDHPPLAKALEGQRRALEALNRAQEKLRQAESAAAKCKPAPAFDEEHATHRIAHAKAHDEVHGVSTLAKVEKAIAEERAAHATESTKAAAAAKSAQSAVDEAAIAVRGIESVWHDANSQVFQLVQERSAEVLPGLVAEAAAKAADLFERVKAIRDVTLAREGGTSNVPAPYVEMSLNAFISDNEQHELAKKVGARLGSSRSTLALMFEE